MAHLVCMKRMAPNYATSTSFPALQKKQLCLQDQLFQFKQMFIYGKQRSLGVE
jgi:hypothetical protein